MMQIVEQKSFFTTSDEKQIVPEKQQKAVSFQAVNLDLLSGLDKDDLNTNWVYYLRILAGKAQKDLRHPSKKQVFIQCLLAEAKAKKGRADPVMALRSLLLNV